jgi:cell wall-associated NlpC family hydrolase
MRKKKIGCPSFFSNRQLKVILKYDSLAYTWKRILEAAIPFLVESGRAGALLRIRANARPCTPHSSGQTAGLDAEERMWSTRAREWWADGWLWMKDDCNKVLDGGLCLARRAISGQWPPVAPAFWKKRGFYGAILALVILAGALWAPTGYLEQIPTAFAVRHTGEQTAMESSPQPAGQQSAVNQITITKAAYELQVTENVVNVRSGPSKNKPEIGQARFGDVLLAKGRSSDNWYQVAFRTGTGWIAGWCVQTYRPSGKASIMVADSSLEGPGTQGLPEASRGVSSDLIGIARRFLGTPYCYGANGTASFDCSGYVRYVYSRLGISLPRVASDQALAGRRVSSPAPGDLVFFSDRRDGYITHVGIYIGNNSFIHASFQGVTITSLDDPWYKSHYVMACSVN